MTNLELARKSLELCINELGPSDVVVCSGSRHSPFLAELFEGLRSQENGEKNIQLYHGFEERSAAFFALGLCQGSGKPVLVLTSSGSAVAECLPAVIEAHYKQCPLIIWSADRPFDFRNTGAPQSIEQNGIFSNYVKDCFDIDTNNSELERLKTFLDKNEVHFPLHINVALDEPLFDDILKGIQIKNSPIKQIKKSAESLLVDIKKLKRPLIVLGPLHKSEAPAVKKFLLKLKAPIWAESLSQLREDTDLKNLRIESGERFLKQIDFDGVIKIGGTPTCRLWRDLCKKDSAKKVFSFSKGPFSGNPRAQHYRLSDYSQLDSLELPKIKTQDYFDKQRDLELLERVYELFTKEPLSEPAYFHWISRVLKEKQNIYLGNSMPIREWDLFTSTRERGFEVFANRGANGIDGQISTALGLSTRKSHMTIIVGDLTALYDLQALWWIDQLPTENTLQIIVINNQGGRIFSRLPDLKRHLSAKDLHQTLECEHSLNFQNWAQMWHLSYDNIQEKMNWPQAQASIPQIIEICPDTAATERFWAQYEKVFGA